MQWAAGQMRRAMPALIRKPLADSKERHARAHTRLTDLPPKRWGPFVSRSRACGSGLAHRTTY